MKINNITARDIPDAWFQCIDKLLDAGFIYQIEQGSFVGYKRLEFDWVTVHIKYPYAYPYDLMLPVIPDALNIPNPVAYGYVEQYLPYLLTSEIKEGESYTYGSRICSQIPIIVEKLKETPNTNQAILQVAKPSDTYLDDPPCLRHIDMRVKDNKLIFYPYFRSWDLWAGFPANLAAISVLHKFMADEIDIEQGAIIASSKGLHLYDYVKELAEVRVGR